MTKKSLGKFIKKKISFYLFLFLYDDKDDNLKEKHRDTFSYLLFPLISKTQAIMALFLGFKQSWLSSNEKVPNRRSPPPSEQGFNDFLLFSLQIWHGLWIKKINTSTKNKWIIWDIPNWQGFLLLQNTKTQNVSFFSA